MTMTNHHNDPTVPVASDDTGSSTRRRRSPEIPPAVVAESLVETKKRHSRFARVALWFRLPALWPPGHFFPVDLTARWRRHLVWAKKDGDDLLKTVTARFTSTTVLLSLLVSAEIGVFFSPSQVTEDVRNALENSASDTLEFWTGIILCVCILFSISALMANFTAWSIFITLSQENAAVVLRSSIGLFSAQTPSRLVVVSIYLFFLWVAMFWWILLPLGWAITLTAVGALQISSIATIYSAMGEVIMATGAMSHEPTISKDEEEKLTPSELCDVLLNQAHMGKKAKVPINQQYRINYHEFIQQNQVWEERLEQGDSSDHH